MEFSPNTGSFSHCECVATLDDKVRGCHHGIPRVLQGINALIYTKSSLVANLILFNPTL
jgi:hypothetical protein